MVEGVLRKGVGRAASVRLLGGHPDPDVRRTVAKHDALAFFELPQQTNDSAIREDEVLEGPAQRSCRSRLRRATRTVARHSRHRVDR